METAFFLLNHRWQVSITKHDSVVFGNGDEKSQVALKIEDDLSNRIFYTVDQLRAVSSTVDYCHVSGMVGLPPLEVPFISRSMWDQSV